MFSVFIDHKGDIYLFYIKVNLISYKQLNAVTRVANKRNVSLGEGSGCKFGQFNLDVLRANIHLYCSNSHSTPYFCRVFQMSAIPKVYTE